MNKNRFKQLLESTMGNVKPLISEIESTGQEVEFKKQKEFLRYIALGDDFFKKESYDRAVENYFNALSLYDNKYKHKNHILAQEKLNLANQKLKEQKLKVKEEAKLWDEKTTKSYDDYDTILKPSFDEVKKKVFWEVYQLNDPEQLYFSFRHYYHIDPTYLQKTQNGGVLGGYATVYYNTYGCGKNEGTINHRPQYSKNDNYEMDQTITFNQKNKDTEEHLVLDDSRTITRDEFEQFVQKGSGAFDVLKKTLLPTK